MISSYEPHEPGSSAAVYQLKVVLLDSEPSIWRRLLVPGNANLGWLHAVLQVAMGWTNSHLHHFITPEARYCDLEYNEDTGFGPKPDLEEKKAKIAQVLPRKGAHFLYEYDFGDSWRHEIRVEQVLPPDRTSSKLAVCVAGARACPPEDCGGVWGYANLLKALKNPKHPEHKDMVEWLGRPIDPEAFDVAHVNTWLKKLKWPRVTDSHLRKVLMGRDDYHEP